MLNKLLNKVVNSSIMAKIEESVLNFDIKSLKDTSTNKMHEIGTVINEKGQEIAEMKILKDTKTKVIDIKNDLIKKVPGRKEKEEEVNANTESGGSGSDNNCGMGI